MQEGELGGYPSRYGTGANCTNYKVCTGRYQLGSSRYRVQVSSVQEEQLGWGKVDRYGRVPGTCLMGSVIEGPWSQPRLQRIMVPKVSTR